MLLAACLLITHSKQLKVMTKSFWPNSEGYPTLFKNSFVSYSCVTVSTEIMSE